MKKPLLFLFYLTLLANYLKAQDLIIEFNFSGLKIKGLEIDSLSDSDRDKYKGATTDKIKLLINNAPPEDSITLLGIKNSGNLPNYVFDITNEIRHSILENKDTAFLKIVNPSGNISFGMIEITWNKLHQSSSPIKGCSCETNKVSAESECDSIVRDFSNNFKENLSLYDHSTITYIYDFNKNINSRIFYKIEKHKYPIKKCVLNKIFGPLKDTLVTSIAHFNKETLTPHKDVRFKIVNINRFMYDVSIADTVLRYSSEPSKLFSSLFIGDSSGLLGTLLGNFNKLYTSGQGTNENETQNILSPDAQALKDIDCFLHMHNKLKSKIIDACNRCTKFPCCMNVDYLGLANKLGDINVELAKLQLDLNGMQKRLNDVASKGCDGIIKLLDAKQADSLATAKIPKMNHTDSVNLKNLADTIKVLKKNPCIASGGKTNGSPMTKNDSLTLDSLNRYSAIVALLNKLPSDESLRKISILVNNIIDENQTYSLDYVPLDGNKLKLDMKISLKDSLKSYLPDYNRNQHIEIPIIDQGFVSFSSGSFVTFGRYMQNETYAWQTLPGNNKSVSDTSRYILTESGYSFPPVGFSALVNYEFKLSKNFGFGASGGVGLTIESNPRLAYLAGGSLFFGDWKQLAVTCGLACMPIDKLSTNLQAVVDQNITYTASLKPTITYYKELQVGSFISLTYTPFNITKKNKASTNNTSPDPGTAKTDSTKTKTTK